MEQFEKVEKIVEKTGVSYEEAKRALFFVCNVINKSDYSTKHNNKGE